MADTIASLGIEVNAKGADKASSDLDKVTKSTRTLTQAQEDLSKALAEQERLRNTGNAFSATGGYTQAYIQATKAVSAARSEIETFGRAAASTAQSTGIFGRALSGIGNLVGSIEGPTIRVNQATRALKIGLQEAGGSLGVLSPVLGAARGGFIALGLAAGGAFIGAMEKASDNVNKVKDGLKVLSGASAGAAFDNIARSARDAGATIQSVYDLTIKLAQRQSSQPQTFVGLPGEGADFSKQSQEINTLIKGFELAGETATAASKATDGLLQSIQKDGRLTSQTFQELIRTAPQLAAEIAKSLGVFDTSFPGLQKFANQLEQNQVKAQQFDAAIRNIGPQIDKLSGERVANLAQGFDHLTTSALNFFAAFGQSVGAGQFMDNLAKRLDIISARLSNPNAPTFWESIVNGAKKASDAAQGIVSDQRRLDDAFEKLGIGMVRTADLSDQSWARMSASASASVQQIMASLDKAINEWLVLGRVQTGAKGATVTAPGPGGPSFTIPGSNGAGSGFGGFFGSGAVGGTGAAGGGSITPGLFDNADTGFATGGSFIVGGSGGRDTTPVSFMATRGEIVTITPANLSTPEGLKNLKTGGSSYLDVGGGASQNWMGGAYAAAVASPIVSAIGQSTASIVGAIGNSSIGVGGITGSAGLPLPGLLTSQGTLTHTTNAPSGSAAAPIGSGPVDAYGNTVGADQAFYVGRINHNSSIAGSAPGGSGQLVYYANPNYGKFAQGGSFVVGGNGGTDTTPVNFMATKGEQVTITPNQRRADSIGGLSNRPININVYGATAPLTFLQAQSQIKRAVRGTFR